MIKWYAYWVVFLLVPIASTAQISLPVKAWTGKDDYPFILYISGDGGINEFNTDLCKTINASGYAIVALNAKSYFWNKKTPEQTVEDITILLEQAFRTKKNQRLALAGYSFGADVMPFIVNRLPESLKKRLIGVVLLAPSTSTDFETHVSDLIGVKRKRSMDVVAEINKMNVPGVITIFGTEDTAFPIKEIRVKNYTNEYLPGGHHFDGNPGEVGGAVIKYLYKHE